MTVVLKEIHVSDVTGYYIEILYTCHFKYYVHPCTVMTSTVVLVRIHNLGPNC